MKQALLFHHTTVQYGTGPDTLSSHLSDHKFIICADCVCVGVFVRLFLIQISTGGLVPSAVIFLLLR